MKIISRKLLNQIRYYCSPSPRRRSAFSEGWDNAFGKHLLFTNTWTSGVLMIGGDIIEQEVEYQRGILDKRYDWSRVGRMFVTGLLFGPLHHYFYGWMDKMLPKRNLTSVGKKILLDQFLMSPACIACFIYTMGALENKSMRNCTKEFKDKFAEVYVFDWFIWPPTQFVNFYFLPVKYQVLYINGITMLYNVFLSYIKHRDEEKLPKMIPQ